MTQKVDDQKYIVFKRSDFYEMMGRLALPPYYGKTSSGRQEMAGKHWDCSEIAESIKEDAERSCLPDAVVIRRQDVFAAPALEAYANAIQCVIEACEVAPALVSNSNKMQALREIADYFHEQAEKSYGTDRKIPG